MAEKVNCVWNYCNSTQKKAARDGRKWLSGFDLNYLTTGSSKELGIHSGIINSTCEQYALSRGSRAWIRFRGAKSLGWIPVKGRDIKVGDKKFIFNKKEFNVFLSRRLPAFAKIKDRSNFSRDSRGRWYLNLVIETPSKAWDHVNTSVGIDLGLKDFAALSTGEKLEAKRFYRKSEDRLAQAQRGRKKRLIKRIHAKIANQRRDFHHKASTKIVREFSHIYVGDVNASGLSKTNLAKSVHDAGWYNFKQMLAYKSIREGAVFKEVSERFSTQVCSGCGSIAGPRGQTDLNKRDWECVHCGCIHDRDVNAAINILRLGCQAPARGAAA